MKNNNIFNFATSELSNDAVICWIINWADSQGDLRSLGIDFINLFTGKSFKNEDILRVNVIKQYNNIDILVEVNESDVIVIEDKTFTKDHSNQLSRYKKIIDSEEKYKNMDKHYIYLKIGNESYYESKEFEGYKRIYRKDILDILIMHKSTNNDILNDYYDYINSIENETNIYKTSEDIKSWPWKAYEGYYNELQKSKGIKQESWNYVSNPRGGFLGFWWYWNEMFYKINNENVPYCLYLQIETNFEYNDENNKCTAKPKIVLRLEVNDEQYQSEIRNYVWEKSKLIINDSWIKCNFAKGRTMSICRIEDVKIKQELDKSIVTAENFLLKLKEIL